MPLLMMCGLPCSGKTTRALQIKALLEEAGEGWTVDIVNDESLGIRKQEGFKSPNAEKPTRATQFSTLERQLTSDPRRILISDSMNYVKGFRYQMHTLAKNHSIPTAVVWCATDQPTCTQWDSSREAGYGEEILTSLAIRFEEPDGRARWDSPLITILPSDELHPVSEDPEGSFARIVRAIAGGKAVKPNLAVVKKQAPDSTLLPLLDRATTSVISSIPASHTTLSSTPPTAVSVSVPGSSIDLDLPDRHVSMSELRRWKNTWIGLVGRGKMPARVADVVKGGSSGDAASATGAGGGGGGSGASSGKPVPMDSKQAADETVARAAEAFVKYLNDNLGSPGTSGAVG
ncbi:chromatin associated protein KTI12 [Gonapodya prolifera JEL478]|uniref:Chromatin associated protein KTI12 n=1 Tax=Gonapodya prolifera (strain JEL478) TaxID=1344416 RepID=A0A139AU46_GONPJ|nr:chromatin associated protein KTI12 [Gonapodya prolifera JEL478]|eukprot:KXS20251.1 chromatin associated protein KTI12 [Gonapodya prolifera JEL478]